MKLQSTIAEASVGIDAACSSELKSLSDVDPEERQQSRSIVEVAEAVPLGGDGLLDRVAARLRGLGGVHVFGARRQLLRARRRGRLCLRGVHERHREHRREHE